MVSGATLLARSAAEAAVTRVRKAAAKTAPAKAVAKAVKKAQKSAPKKAKSKTNFQEEQCEEARSQKVVKKGG